MADTGPAPAASSLTLRLFGPFEVRLHREPLPRLRTRKGEWLLALLALRHGAPVDRGWLGGLLWPASTRSHALRNSLTDLRRALGEEAGRLRSPTSQTLSLDLAGAEVDVLLFDAAIARSDESSLEAAVSLYRGPLLEGCVEEWVVEEREAREQAYLGALERLAAGALARGEHTAAESWLRRVVGVDPLRESAQRALMETLAAGGSYAAASVTYRELRLLLQRELNSQPDPETERLFQQLRAEARSKAALGARCSVLGERNVVPAVQATGPIPTEHRAPSAERRSGATLTFLLTDIEGSAQLWEQHPDAMRVALARHDALLRHALQSHGGEVFRSRGDQFCAAFAAAPDALAAVLAAQRALQREAWEETGALRVRMALHSGTAEQREKEYSGPALNRLARLLDTGHGGQILLTLATVELVRDQLPERADLRDLGEHRLPDLTRPEPIFQLVVPDLPATFPPLRSLEAFRHNLPLQLSRFIGREREMAEVKQLLATTRLLTLTGSGGCGKTRLALQVAAEVLEAYRDGVWLVELAALADPALVPQTVAVALGVREDPGRPITQTLTEYLRPKQVLLLLDNCEHLLSASAQLAEALLRACPKLRILASSREALGIAGEQTYRVPSLSLPDPRHLPPLERLREFEAVQLFADRARLSQATFALTQANARAVAQVCEQLDGIPLALELAASRVKALPVEQIVERLDDRFHLLTGGSRTALPRQQTLRAAMDWSHDLLTEAERTLLRRLSVFAGGWSLDAAEAVVTGEGIDAWEVLERLTALVEKSLVQYEEQAGEGRYRLLETVRQYARDRLLEAGEAEAVRERHRDWCLALAEQAEPEFVGADQAAWLDRLEREHDNLRAALERCRVEPGGNEEELRLAGALRWFWSIRGYLREGRGWLEGALAQTREAASGTSSERTPVRAKALYSAGILAWLHGDNMAARPLLEEGLTLSRETGDTWGVAWSLLYLGQLERGEGNHAVAHSLLEECLAISREQGYRWGIAWALNCLGVVANAQGDYAAARSRCEESLALFRELEDATGAAWSLLHLGDAARLQHDHERAAFYQESLALFQEPWNRRGIAYALEGLAGEAVEQGRLERAAGLFGTAEALRDAMGALMSPVDRSDYERQVARARASLGAAAFAAGWEAGRAMSLEDAVEYALREQRTLPSPVGSSGSHRDEAHLHAPTVPLPSDERAMTDDGAAPTP